MVGGRLGVHEGCEDRSTVMSPRCRCSFLMSATWSASQLLLQRRELSAGGEWSSSSRERRAVDHRGRPHDACRQAIGGRSSIWGPGGRVLHRGNPPLARSSRSTWLRQTGPVGSHRRSGWSRRWDLREGMSPGQGTFPSARLDNDILPLAPRPARAKMEARRGRGWRKVQREGDK